MSLIGRFIAALVALVLVATPLAPSFAAASMPYAVTVADGGATGEAHDHADHPDKDGGHERGDLAHHAQTPAHRVTAEGVEVRAALDPGSMAYRLPTDEVAPHGLAPATPDEPPRR